ncbi:hypothetical protein JCM11641_007775 [Rhodosporidiobolus odoratus]
MVSSAVPGREAERDDLKRPTSRTRYTAPPSTPSPRLPTEIQLAIIQSSISPRPTYSHLPVRQSILAKYSLVCRTWNILARGLLYRHLLLDTPERARLFLRSVKGTADPRPAQVRTLRLATVPWLGSTFENMAEEQTAIARGERDDPWDSGVAEGFGLAELLQRCTYLKELWMAGIKHCLLSELRHAQNLEALHVLRCSLCDCDTDTYELSNPPLIFPKLTRAELFIRLNSTTVHDAFFSPTVLPALRHFGYACHDEDYPSTLPLSSLTALSTVTDLPNSLASAPLLLLDAYQLPVREALSYLPPSLLILRLNDFSPLQHAFPWLLIDHSTSDELAERLPNLRELWVPGSYSEWRGDKKESVREMVVKWVRGWEERGVKVVFEEEAEENRGLVAEEKRLTEGAAWDVRFAHLCRKVERWKLEESEGG